MGSMTEEQKMGTENIQVLTCVFLGAKQVVQKPAPFSQAEKKSTIAKNSPTNQTKTTIIRAAVLSKRLYLCMSYSFLSRQH